MKFIRTPRMANAMLDNFPLGDGSIIHLLAMKSMSKRNPFPGGAIAPEESRFEKFEIEPFFERAASAHFSRKLQKIFPVPSESSEPEDVRVLLSKIQAKLNNLPVPKGR